MSSVSADSIAAKGASCLNCKCPLSDPEMLVVVNRAHKHGTGLVQHKCANCNAVMEIHAKAKVKITVWTSEVKS